MKSTLSYQVIVLSCLRVLPMECQACRFTEKWSKACDRTGMGELNFCQIKNLIQKVANW